MGASWLLSHIARTLISTAVRTPFGRADELEADIQAVRGGDEAAALRRLEDGLKKLRVAFKVVKGLAQGAEEAAAKLQVRYAVLSCLGFSAMPRPVVHLSQCW